MSGGGQGALCLRVRVCCRYCSYAWRAQRTWGSADCEVEEDDEDEEDEENSFVEGGCCGWRQGVSLI